MIISFTFDTIIFFPEAAYCVDISQLSMSFLFSLRQAATGFRRHASQPLYEASFLSS